MMDIKHTTQPSSEPVTASEVKAKLNITYSDDDTMIGTFITTARQQIERYCSIAIGSQTKTWIFDGVGGVEYSIPYQPVISVDNVYEKTDYNTYTALVAYDDYDVDGSSYKTLTPFIGGRFKVEYTTGYTTIPQGLKDAVLSQVAYLYEHRGDTEQGGLSPMAKDKADQYKDYSWL